MFIFDVETLGKRSNSVILSMAAIYFDPDTKPSPQELRDSAFFAKFSVVEQVKQYGREMNQPTMDWWKKQCDNVRTASFLPNEVDCSFVDGYEKDIDQALDLVGQDIKNLKDIKDNAEKGLATCEELLQEKRSRGVKTILAENETYSKAAEGLARLNPLVGISIYAESRRIQAKELRVKASIGHLLRDKDDLKIRVEPLDLVIMWNTTVERTTQLELTIVI